MEKQLRSLDSNAKVPQVSMTVHQLKDAGSPGRFVSATPRSQIHMRAIVKRSEFIENL